MSALAALRQTVTYGRTANIPNTMHVIVHVVTAVGGAYCRRNIALTGERFTADRVDGDSYLMHCFACDRKLTRDGAPTPAVSAPPRMVIGPRSPIRRYVPTNPTRGTSRTWMRTINGTPHAFVAVSMPDGERRYSVRRYNGYCDDGTPEGRKSGMRFGCAWSPVHFVTVAPADPAEENRRYTGVQRRADAATADVMGVSTGDFLINAVGMVAQVARVARVLGVRGVLGGTGQPERPLPLSVWRPIVCEMTHDDDRDRIAEYALIDDPSPLCWSCANTLGDGCYRRFTWVAAREWLAAANEPVSAAQ